MPQTQLSCAAHSCCAGLWWYAVGDSSFAQRLQGFMHRHAWLSALTHTRLHLVHQLTICKLLTLSHSPPTHPLIPGARLSVDRDKFRSLLLPALCALSVGAGAGAEPFFAMLAPAGYLLADLHGKLRAVLSKAKRPAFLRGPAKQALPAGAVCAGRRGWRAASCKSKMHLCTTLLSCKSNTSNPPGTRIHNALQAGSHPRLSLRTDLSGVTPAQLLEAVRRVLPAMHHHLGTAFSVLTEQHSLEAMEQMDQRWVSQGRVGRVCACV